MGDLEAAPIDENVSPSFDQYSWIALDAEAVVVTSIVMSYSIFSLATKTVACNSVVVNATIA